MHTKKTPLRTALAHLSPEGNNEATGEPKAPKISRHKNRAICGGKSVRLIGIHKSDGGVAVCGLIGEERVVPLAESSECLCSLAEVAPQGRRHIKRVAKRPPLPRGPGH